MLPDFELGKLFFGTEIYFFGIKICFRGTEIAVLGTEILFDHPERRNLGTAIAAIDIGILSLGTENEVTDVNGGVIGAGICCTGPKCGVTEGQRCGGDAEGSVPSVGAFAPFLPYGQAGCLCSEPGSLPTERSLIFKWLKNQEAL